VNGNLVTAKKANALNLTKTQNQVILVRTTRPIRQDFVVYAAQKQLMMNLARRYFAMKVSCIMLAIGIMNGIQYRKYNALLSWHWQIYEEI